MTAADDNVSSVVSSPIEMFISAGTVSVFETVTPHEATNIKAEAALDMLEKTNIDELTDSECRELLKDMAEALK